MSVVCPCCKAVNDAGPHCRRCRADLSLLFAWSARQSNNRHEAVRALLAGDYAGALKRYFIVHRNWNSDRRVA